MRRTFSSIVALGALSLAPIGQAAVVFNFSGDPVTNALSGAGTQIGYNSFTGAPTISGGQKFDGSDGTGATSISARVYGVTGATNLGGANSGGPGAFSGGLDLFAVTHNLSFPVGNNINPNTTGIAPYRNASGPSGINTPDVSGESGLTQNQFPFLRASN